MRSKRTTHKMYECVTSGALFIGFFATVSMNYWPQFSSVAGIIMIFVTVVAMAFYFAARYGQADIDSQSATNSPSDMRIQEAVEDAVETREKVRPVARGVANVQPDEEKERLQPTRRAEWREWEHFYNSLDALTTRDASARLLHTARLLKSFQRMPDRGFDKFFGGSNKIHEPKMFLFDTGSFYSNDLGRKGYLSYRRELSHLLNERDISLFVDESVMAQSTEAGGSEKPANPVVVKIGPVTVEIRDNETRVHVTSSKPVITNVSEPKRATTSDEAVQGIRNVETSKVIH